MNCEAPALPPREAEGGVGDACEAECDDGVAVERERGDGEVVPDDSRGVELRGVVVPRGVQGDLGEDSCVWAAFFGDEDGGGGVVRGARGGVGVDGDVVVWGVGLHDDVSRENPG